MDNKILNALCEEQYPNLLNACQHSPIATFYAHRFIKGMSKFGHLKYGEINKSKGLKARIKKINETNRLLVSGEIHNKF